MNVSVSEVNDFDLVIFSVYTMLCICFWIPILLQRGGGGLEREGFTFCGSVSGVYRDLGRTRREKS